MGIAVDLEQVLAQRTGARVPYITPKRTSVVAIAADVASATDVRAMLNIDYEEHVVCEATVGVALCLIATIGVLLGIT